MTYILLVDDDMETLHLVQDTLSLHGYEVACVTSGYDALLSIQYRLPDLVVLDVYMAHMSGLEVCQQIRQNPRGEYVPILVMTSGVEGHLEAELLSIGADDYWRKTSDQRVFLERIKKLVKVNRPPPPKICTFCVDLSESIQYKLSGGISRRGQPIPLSINRDAENSRIAFIGQRTYEYHTEWRRRLGTGRYSDIVDEERYLSLRGQWRPQAMTQGRELYEKLFLKNGRLMEDWGRIQQIVGPVHERLIVRFGGPRENLGLPYELLHDVAGPLIVRHPMARKIDGVTTSKPSWHSTLQLAKGRTLNALIITGFSGAVEEAQIVATKLREALAQFDVGLSVDPPDLSRPLTYSEVIQWLEQGTHEIVHFAGHSVFDFERPENSHLILLDDESTECKIITSHLHSLLVNSQTQFVFLSSCSGAEITTSDVSSEDNTTYLGLLDAVVKSGVPAAIGYRWPVVGRSARLFASYFYDGLIRYPASLEHAAWYARKRIFEATDQHKTKFPADGWDETWFSPMLIVQNPD